METDFVKGEFVKVVIDVPFFGRTLTFVRFVAWCEGQAAVEDANGHRSLVDRERVQALDFQLA